MRKIILTLCASIIGVGCSDKDSLVVIDLTASPALSGITRVHTEAVAGGITRTFDLGGGATGSTPLTYGIDLPRSITGNLVLTVSVYDAKSNLLGSGALTTPIKLGAVLDVDVPLTPANQAMPDMAAAPGDLDNLPSQPDLALPATLTIDRTLNDFGPITIGHTSSVATFKITNSGTVATAMPMLSTASLAGQATDFTITTTCNAPIQPLDSCQVSATLMPSAAGSEDETFTISAGSDMVTGEVKGNALTAGQISLTPDSGDCGAALLGQKSAKTAMFTAKNTGQTTTSTLVVSTNDPQFLATGCNVTLMPMSTCTVTVTFTAGSKRGAFTQALVVSNGASDPSPATASITGVAQSPPIVAISPSASGAFAFATGPRGSAAGSQTFTVTNSGDVATATLAATAITGGNSGDFSITSDKCGGTTLAAGPTGCTVAVTFTPGATGARASTMSINGSASPVAQVALNGSGTPIWTRETVTSPPSGSLRSVWAADATGTHVWAVGDNGAAFYRSASGTWTAGTGTASGDMFTWVTGTSATDQWAIAGSALYRASGDNTWKGLSSETTSTYGGIFVFNANDVWVTQSTQTGSLGNIGVATQAIQMTQSGTGTTLTAASGCDMIWGSSDSNLFCAYNTKHCTSDCNFGWGMAHEDATGNNWATVQMGSGITVNASAGPVWGSSGSDVYVGVSNNHTQHYNGTAWAAVDPSAPSDVAGIWGSSATNVYFVGSFGIAQGNGSSWSAPITFNSLAAAGIHGTGPNDIYVVGSDATGMCVYHWF